MRPAFSPSVLSLFFKLKLRGGDPLARYIALVSLAHLALISGISLVDMLGDSFFSWQSKQLEVVQSSVRVDVVAMPKWTQKELQQMEVASPKAASVEKAAPVQGSSFLDKIRQFSRQKVPVKAATQKQRKKVSLDHKREKRLGQLILAGNKLSAGTSPTGKINSEQLSELRRYMESLPRYVRPHWVLPSYLKGQGLQCRIRLSIGRGGKLLKTIIVESSGNEQYDNYALQAIEQAELPEPDKALVNQLVRGVVILGFPL